MSAPPTAAAWACRQVDAVRDEPAARLELLARTYRGPIGWAPQHLPFRRAALSFMRWQVKRGVLAPLNATPPGSPWWRAVNERLLRDGCEAVSASAGLGGPVSSPTIEMWMTFISDPTPGNWYRAHNASIVSAYLEQRGLAEAEHQAERFFLNVVLLRMLYAHALVAAPRLALGWLSWLAPVLSDPRLGMTGIFLSLSRILPGRYPLGDQIEIYVSREHKFGKVLDLGVIEPRLQQLYEWSAEELGEPALLSCIHDGSPIYAWPHAVQVWQPARPIRAVRALHRLLPPSRSGRAGSTVTVAEGHDDRDTASRPAVNDD
jgi:hypothetical protein